MLFRSRVPSKVIIHIYTAGGPSVLLQELGFDIHCSFGLWIGDVFGATTVTGFSTTTNSSSGGSTNSLIPPPSSNGLVLASIDVEVELPTLLPTVHSTTEEQISYLSLDASPTIGFFGGTVNLLDQIPEDADTNKFQVRLDFNFDYTLGPTMYTSTAKLVGKIGGESSNSDLCLGESSTFTFQTGVGRTRGIIVVPTE